MASLLRRVRAGQTDAAGLLADYLEENGLPYAKSVRAAWRALQAEEGELWSRPASHFRGAVRWERIARARAKLRKTISSVYGRAWAELPLRRYTGGDR